MVPCPAMQDPDYVRRAFSSIADRYVVTNHVLSLGVDIWWRRLTARRVAALQPRRVLDLATGSGDLAAAIRKRLPEAEIVAADFCLPMLAHARKRGLQSLIVADAMALPFEDASFDAVTVAYGLRNMASWPEAAAEMARVLRPGGHLLVLDFSLPAGWLRAPYRFYLHRLLPTVAGWITRRREAYEYLGGSIERFPSGQAMESLLTTAGFTQTSTTPLMAGVSSLYVATR